MKKKGMFLCFIGILFLVILASCDTKNGNKTKDPEDKTQPVTPVQTVETYTVVFDAGKGFFDDGNSIKTIKVEKGQYLELYKPQYGDFYYDSWVDSDGNKWDFTKPVTSNLNLRAVYFYAAANIVSVLNSTRIDHDSYKLELDSQNEVVDLENLVTVSSNCEWSLRQDGIDVPKKLSLKDGTLKKGTNYFEIFIVNNKSYLTATKKIIIQLPAEKVKINYYIDESLVYSDEANKDEIYNVSYIPTLGEAFNFSGWIYNDSYVDKLYVTDEINLYGKYYTKSCEISFDSNGGKLALEDDGILLVEFDKRFRCPIPTKDGYKFVGWEYDNELITDYLGKSLSKNKLDGSITVKAVWEKINTYSLNIDLNIDAAGYVVGNGDYIEGENCLIKAVPNQDYIFNGWYINGKLVCPSLEYSFTITEDVTIEAMFTKVLTVSYIVDIYMENTDRLFDKIDSISLSGKEGEMTNYAPEAKAGYSVEVEQKVISSTNPEKVKVYYKLKTVTVTLISENNDMGTVSKSKTHGLYSSQVEIEANSKDGYEFVGWYLDGKLVSKDSKCNILVPSDDVTIEARFAEITIEPIYYPVHFVTNCEKNIDDILVLENEFLTEPKNITRQPIEDYDYELVGWFENEELTKQYDFSSKVVSELTLYAKWNRVEKNIFIFSFFESEGVEYASIIGNTITTRKDIVIPDNYEGKKVIGISSKAFENCQSITRIEIPNTVSIIYEKAFSGCNNLEEIVVEENIDGASILIDETAFEKCIGLKKVIIPTDILNFSSSNIFKNSSIEEAIVTTCNIKYVSNDNLKCLEIVNEKVMENYFEKCPNLKSLTINSSTITFRKNAFDSINSLENVYYNGTIEEWCKIKFMAYNSNPMSKAKNFYILDENGTFDINNKKYTLLDELVIPETITAINDYQFYGFDQIVNMYIGSSLNKIGTEAFGYTSGSKSIYYESSISNWINIEMVSLSSNPMNNFDSFYILDENGKIEKNGNKYSLLKELIIPNSVDCINDYSFVGFKQISSILFGNNLISIGDDAFKNISETCSIYYCGNIDEWASICFSTLEANPMKKQSSFYIIDKNGAIEYNDLTYSYIDKLEINVSELTNYSFSNFKQINELIVKEKNIKIGVDVFANNNIVNAVIPANLVQEINNDKLKELYITDGKELVEDCLSNAVSLTIVHIPVDLTKIDNNVFEKCVNLTKVYYDGGINNWSNIDFVNEKSNPIAYSNALYLNKTDGDEEYYNKKYELLTDLVFDDSTVIVKKYRFVNYKNAKKAVFVNKTTVVEEFAFLNCAFEEANLPVEGLQYLDKTKLSKLYIISGDELIKDYFIGLENLSDLIISSDIKEIEFGCLSGLINLKSIELPFIGSKRCSLDDDNKEYVLGWLFGEGNKEDSYYMLQPVFDMTSGKAVKYFLVPKSLERVVVTDSIYLPSHSFYYCKNLIEVEIKCDLLTVGACSFSGCSGLSCINLPDSVKSIGNYAMSSCTGIESIILPKSLEMIGEKTFSNSKNLVDIVIYDNLVMVSGDFLQYEPYSLQNVYYNGTFDSWCNIEFKTEKANPMYYAENFYIQDENGSVIFNNDKYNLPTSIVCENATKIGDYQFYGFSQTNELIMPTTINFVGDSPFINCKFEKINIPSIVLPKISSKSTVEEAIITGDILKSGLNNSSNLKKLELKSCSVIGESAFCYDYGLTEVVLPEELITIGSNAFGYCSALTNIDFTKNITEIGESAFTKCSKITSLVFPISLKVIGKEAFYNCTKLESVYINSTLEEIGEYAFGNCSKLAIVSGIYDGVNVDCKAFSNCDSLPVEEYYGAYYIKNSSGSKFMLKKAIASNVENLKIDINCIGIMPNAFSNSTIDNIYYDGTIDDWNNIQFGNEYSVPQKANTKLYIYDSDGNVTFENKNYSLPTKVEINSDATIGNYKFSNLTQIEEVEINCEKVSFDYSCFSNCNVTSLKILGTVDKISETCFEGNPLKKVVAPSNVIKVLSKSLMEDVTITSGTKLEVEEFKGATNLVNISIPDTIEKIGTDCFAECDNLKSNYRNGCRYLGNTNNKYLVLLSYNGSDTSCTVEAGCKIIYNNSFYNKTKLKYVYLPDTICFIGAKAFAGMNLDSINIPLNCINIESWAFAGSVDKVYYQGSLNDWCNIVFVDSGSNPADSNKFFILSSDGTDEYNGINYMNTANMSIDFTYPNVTEVGDYQFYRMNLFKSITFPEGVKSIGRAAFWYDTELESIKLPNSVRYIYDNAFDGCENLGNVVLPDNLYELGNDAFCSTNITNITIPASVRVIGENCFYRSKLQHIVFEDGTNKLTIENYVFANCRELVSIVLPKNVSEIGLDVLRNCVSLTTIEYRGTKKEWEAVTKASRWCYDTTLKTIKCSDGTVDISWD